MNAHYHMNFSCLHKHTMNLPEQMNPWVCCEFIMNIRSHKYLMNLSWTNEHVNILWTYCVFINILWTYYEHMNPWACEFIMNILWTDHEHMNTWTYYELLVSSWTYYELTWNRWIHKRAANSSWTYYELITNIWIYDHVENSSWTYRELFMSFLWIYYEHRNILSCTFEQMNTLLAPCEHMNP